MGMGKSSTFSAFENLRHRRNSWLQTSLVMNCNCHQTLLLSLTSASRNSSLDSNSFHKNLIHLTDTCTSVKPNSIVAIIRLLPTDGLLMVKPATLCGLHLCLPWDLLSWSSDPHSCSGQKGSSATCAFLCLPPL